MIIKPTPVIYNSSMEKNPQFIIYTGSMWSGKTSSMLALLERYKYQKKTVLAFKPKIDDRYSVDDITTHSGWSIPATAITADWEIVSVLNELEVPPDVIAVDEMFMIEKSSEVLIWLFRSGFNIVVSSLDLSATCTPFEEVKNILPWATEIHKCKAVCVVCGADAQYTYRTNDEEKNEIAIGGQNDYECRCSRCHPGFKTKD